MLSTLDRYIIARDSNVVRVDFSRDPDPPTPCFPGASAMRIRDADGSTDVSAAENAAPYLGWRS